MRYRGQSENIVSSDNYSDENKNMADEKYVTAAVDEELNGFEQAIESELNVTEQDLIEAKATAEAMTLEGVKAVRPTTVLTWLYYTNTSEVGREYQQDPQA